jgi:hypothetical protein
VLPLALPLLVPGIRGADHADHALAADHLALHADFLDRSANLHGFLQPAKTPENRFPSVPHPQPRLTPSGPSRNEGSAGFNSGAAPCQYPPGRRIGTGEAGMPGRGWMRAAAALTAALIACAHPRATIPTDCLVKDAEECLWLLHVKDAIGAVWRKQVDAATAMIDPTGCLYSETDPAHRRRVQGGGRRTGDRCLGLEELRRGLPGSPGRRGILLRGHVIAPASAPH